MEILDLIESYFDKSLKRSRIQENICAEKKTYKNKIKIKFIKLHSPHSKKVALNVEKSQHHITITRLNDNTKTNN